MKLRAPFSRLVLTLALAGCHDDVATTPIVVSGPQPDGSATFTADQNLWSLGGVLREPQPDDWFADVTPGSGVDFTYRNGIESRQFLFIESFGGGAAMVDVDLDSDVDLFFTGGGTISSGSVVNIGGLPSGLFRNNGGFDFTDVTESAALAAQPDYSQGCTVGDFNADGFPDLCVCCVERTRMYCNLGDATFAAADPIPASASTAWDTAAAFGDADGDGLPDLFVARYTDWSVDLDHPCLDEHGVRDLCGPTAYDGTRCAYFHNSADGSFEDWSMQSGITGHVHGLGVAAADLDNDGWLDFYVSSDAMPNRLYAGQPGGVFVERALEAGVAYGEWGQPEASMGIALGDYDGNGELDIFVTNYELEDNSLYQSVGPGMWMQRTVATGLSGVSRMRSGFGTSFTDFDGDGWLDLFVLNGNTLYSTAESPYRQQPQLFRNAQGERFIDVSAQGGSYFAEYHSGRGSAVGDLNEDGAPDIVTVLMNEPVRILRNRLPVANYVAIRLCGRFGDRDATGARVSIESSGRMIVRSVIHGTNYFSHDDTRLVFPLEADVPQVDVTVEWPARGRELFQGLLTRRTHYLAEGSGEVIDGRP
jgi:hypothetical protein